MVEILLIIPSSTSQKSTHYPYFILKSVPIILTLSFALLFQVLTSRYKQGLDMYFVVAIV